MFFIKGTLVVAFLFLFAFTGCKPEVNAPGDENISDEALYKFETVDSDLNLLQDGGIPIEARDGVFSIGWNEVFRKSDDDSLAKGMAFAVAFNESTTKKFKAHKTGIDMGEITINYSSNSIKMHKMKHPHKGFAYSLFDKPFGASENLLQYLPNAQYNFNVSGSDKFSPIELTLTSPAALIDITSHSFKDSVDANQDLTIIWSGGGDSKTAIRVMAHFPNVKPGPPHKKVFVKILENNSGQYTITSDQLKQITSGGKVHKIAIEVSQADRTEVEHDGKTLHTIMRNGSSVLLNVK